MDDGAPRAGDALPHDGEVAPAPRRSRRRRRRRGRRSRRARPGRTAGSARWLTTSSAQSRPCASSTASSIGSGCGHRGEDLVEVPLDGAHRGQALGPSWQDRAPAATPVHAVVASDGAGPAPARRRPPRRVRSGAAEPCGRSTCAVSRNPRNPAARAVLAHPHHRRLAVPRAALRGAPPPDGAPVAPGQDGDAPSAGRSATNSAARHATAGPGRRARRPAGRRP